MPTPPTGSPPSPPRRRNPWWIPPFLGRVPESLEERHLGLLGAAALALLVEEYDLAMLTSALKFIAADLGMRETELGSYLGIVRLGAIPAILFIPFADRIGRRRVFLASLLGTALFTVATAFSQTAGQFVVLQMATRTFFIAGSAVAFVMIAEEFPAAHRGWGIGMLAALGTSGHGVGAILFSFIEVLPYGWRSLYALGVVPLALFPWFRARLQETGRFERHRADRAAAGPDPGGLGAWLQPLVELARTYPGRALGLTGAAAFAAFGMVAAFQFTGYYTQEVRGWEPWQYSVMLIVGGGMGITGNIVAGRLGDRFGRRAVGFAVFGSFPLFVSGFYLGPGPLVPIAWVGFVFCSSAGRTITRAFATELFPTSQRGTSTGWWAMVDTLAAAAGLFALGLLTDQSGELRTMTPLLGGSVLLAALVVLSFPETSSRELEAISGDGAAEAAASPGLPRASLDAPPDPERP